MKLKVWIATLLISLPFLAHADYRERLLHISREYSAGSDVLLTIYTDCNDDIFVYAIDKARYSATPEWDGTGNPPYSFSRAMTTAKEIITTRYSPNGTVSLSSITLQRIETDRIPNRWFYTITYDEIVKDNDHNSRVEGQWTVYLLMDGTEAKSRKYVDD